MMEEKERREKLTKKETTQQRGVGGAAAFISSLQTLKPNQQLLYTNSVFNTLLA